MKVSSHYPTTIDIDGEPLHLLIQRMKRDEWIEFAAEFERVERVRRGNQLLLERKPGEDALTEEDVFSKRLMELTPEERERRLQEELEETRRSTVFGTEAISRYVKAAHNALYDEDASRYVTEGADIVHLFSQRHDVLSALLAEIFIQNRLPENAKKNLRLLRASTRGSSDSAAGTGSSPVPTAASVENETSAESAAAMVSLEPSPSGATAPSS